MNVETNVEILKRVRSQLLKLGFEIQSTDFQRPWGGFFVIDPVDTKKFINQFYPELAEELASTNLPLSPKILCVAPSQRLSWR
jgi:hypothetical protein